MSEYSTLVENSDADITIIKEALERHHLEVNAFLNTGKYPYNSNKKTLPSITMVSYFQLTEEQKALLMEEQRNMELLTVFQELIREYPPCSFEKSSTLEEIESACRLHEEHHAKVVNIAGVMLADLFGSLNKARLTSDGLQTNEIGLLKP